jgi:hypothetical protein
MYASIFLLLSFLSVSYILFNLQELAISTRREAQDPKLQNNIFVKKTDMASAVHPFDLSNIAIPLLTFGHLGSEIVGPDRWKNLLTQEIFFSVKNTKD